MFKRATAGLMVSAVLFSVSVLSSKTLNVLGIGNSLTVNAGKYIEGLASASGNKLRYTGAVIMGASLKDHYSTASINEAEPGNGRGKPYNVYGGKAGLKDILRREKWDLVFFQQVSWSSHIAQSYRPYAGELYAYIKKYSPGAEVCLLRTWAYREDLAESVLHMSSEEMDREIVSACGIISKELNCRVIPCGKAFMSAGNVPGLKSKLYTDGKHAGTYGEYLAGCVLFEALFNQSCVGNTYVPSIEPEKIKQMQELAHEAAGIPEAKQ